MAEATKFSPMLAQYFGLAEKHPEALLLMRVGDFYEAYGEYAQTLAQALQIALTSKEAGGGQRVAMAGVPHHALNGYLAKLVGQRHVVALAEQLEEPVANKLVRRDVVRIVTPGTLIEEHLLDAKQNNYLAAVVGVGEALALAYIDISTGYAAATAFIGDAAFEVLLREVLRIGPSEVVADISAGLRARLASALDASAARVATSPLTLVAVSGRTIAEGFSQDEGAALGRALDALAAFVKRSGVAGESEILNRVTYYRDRESLELDTNTRKHLELLHAQGQNPRATLFATLDLCASGMGSRLLARWIAAPSIDGSEIARRADAVAALVDGHARREALRELLRGCFDLERIAQKVRLGRAAPRDLASLRRTLEVIRPLADVVPEHLRAMCVQIADFGGLHHDLEATLTLEPPVQLAEGGVIRPESNDELARCVTLRTNARTEITQLEERERERTGIKSLRVKYASAFGYSIEVNKSYAHVVPPEYVRKQTLTTGERYITPELKQLELAIANAQSCQGQLETRLFAELVERIALRVDELARAAQVLAEIDCFAALAQAAAERGYMRPEFVEASTLSIQDGRHPVMEAILGTHFVPNDCGLREEEHRFILLTGPNMGGKSTYLRQTGLLVIMAQIGSFVPAKAMRLGIVERIFTRIGAGDDLASGQSTFFMEMAEAANILRGCVRRSLVLVDEVGRGTGTLDGLAIAQAICEYLLALESNAPMVLFATHFHELCALAEHSKRVANYHITAVENTARDGAPVFSHRVQPGSSSRSFGIEVARMAGLPEAVVARAQEIAEALAGNADLETRVPLRRRLANADAMQRQLSLLG